MAFDGIDWPLLRVYAGFGAGNPPADVLRLGVGPGLGTGKLGGGLGWINIAADVLAFSRRFGADNDLVAATPGTCTLVVDNASGNYDPANLSGPYVSGGVSLIDIGVPVQVVAEYPAGTPYARFTGEIVDIQPDDGYAPTITFTCADGLEKLGRTKLTAQSTPVYDGDTSGTRIGHLCDAASWPSSLRSLDTGYAPLGPTVLGDYALPLMQKTELTEVGRLFCNEAGVLVFYDRWRAATATRSTNVQAALTDTGGASDVEMATLTRGRSRDRTINDWHITRDPDPYGEDEPVEQVAFDQASVDAYGTLSGPTGIGELCRDDAQALMTAQGLLPRYAAPATRIREVTVDALSQGRWAQLLPLTLLDRISVSRDYGPVTVTGELLIQAVGEEIRNDDQGASWGFTFTTTAPPPAPDLFILGTSQLNIDGLGW